MFTNNSDLAEASFEISIPLPSTSRAEVVDDDFLDLLGSKRIPHASVAKQDWAYRLFLDWETYRNSRPDPCQHIENILTIDSDVGLSRTLAKFIMEVKPRRAGQSDYAGKTLYEIIASLQSFLRRNGKTVTLLNIQNPGNFKVLHDALDFRMKELARAGVGASTKRAPVISLELEEKLWKSNICNMDTPVGLYNSIFYLVGLNFALRGGRELYNLRIENFVVESSVSGERSLVFHEDVSKSNQGGLMHRKINAKHVEVKENTEKPTRCVVRAFSEYVNRCPKVNRPSAFFLQPIYSPETEIWFSTQRVGIHKLNSTLSKITEKAGCSQRFTNHSLRRTAATRTYQAGFDDKAVSSVTGHRSTAIQVKKKLC